jgi:hypothetical protein
MQLTSQHKKFIWTGAVVLALIHFGPPFINGFRHMVSGPARQAPASGKPSAAHPAQQPAQKPQVTIAGISPDNASEAAQFSRLVGSTWIGDGMITGRGSCRLALHLKMSTDKPGYYAGYSTVTCRPNLVLLGKAITRANMAADTMNQITPTSVIMTGSVVNGEIKFIIDRNIGVPPDGCEISAFTVSPFGNQIAAEWETDHPAPGITCKGGQLVLNRVTNLI